MKFNTKKELSLARKYLREQNRQYPRDSMIMIPEDRWPPSSLPVSQRPRVVYRSRDYLAQVYDESHPSVAARISVCRTELQFDGRMKDDITWDELFWIKAQCGFGHHHAVEVYPSTLDLVNVANMRHLFVLNTPPEYAWRDK